MLGAFCAANPVASASVDLNVGDMYFFKTDNVKQMSFYIEIKTFCDGK